MIRKARVADVKEIRRILQMFARRGELLPRTMAELYSQVRDYYVYQEDSQGPLCGIAALHVSWEDLGEIRSVAVARGEIGKGLGTGIIRACLDEARRLEIARVFVLTYIAGYFERFGFREVGRDELPHKIWADCIKCPKFPECGEVPMVIDLASR